MTVEIHSRYKTVRLYLNNKLVAERETGAPRQIEVLIDVPYAPGLLRVAGVDNGKEIEEQRLETVGDPVALRLTPDRAGLHADGQDLSFVSVEIVDDHGRLQPNAEHLVTLSLNGPGEIAGLGNANLKSEESYRGTECHVFHGKALVVLRAFRQEGSLILRAKAPGLRSAETTIVTKSQSSSGGNR